MELLTYEINSEDIAYYTKGELPQGFISLEYEISFLPTAKDGRMIYQLYKDRLSGVPTREALLQLIREDLIASHGFKIDEEEDGMGLEIHTPIATLAAHRARTKDYKSLLQHLQELGFSYALGHAGIHLNIDYSLLGDTKAQQYSSLMKLLLFVRNNNDFIVALSRREYNYQKHSDIFHMIGDPFGTLNHMDYERRVEETVSDLKPYFMEDKALLTPFNMNLSKLGRKCLEIRWFNSTLDVLDFMGIIEFIPAFVNFLKKDTPLQLENFCEFVKNNYTKYTGLYSNLLDNPYSYPYSVQGVKNMNDR